MTVFRTDLSILIQIWPLKSIQDLKKFSPEVVEDKSCLGGPVGSEVAWSWVWESAVGIQVRCYVAAGEWLCNINITVNFNLIFIQFCIKNLSMLKTFCGRIISVKSNQKIT